MVAMFLLLSAGIVAVTARAHPHEDYRRPRCFDIERNQCGNFDERQCTEAFRLLILFIKNNPAANRQRCFCGS
jgi:hypothetical protein